MSSNKEPHFFSNRDVYVRGMQWHDDLFTPDTSEADYYGESSTSYCYDEEALALIKSDLDDPRLIILMRDPVERTLSHYKWLWALGLEDRPLLMAIREEEQNGYDVHRSVNASGCYATYLRGSQFSTYVPLIESLFGQAHVLCLRSTDLRAHPQECLRQCFDFLALKAFEITFEINANETASKTVRRTFGLEKISRAVPWMFNLVDADHRIRRTVGARLGRKQRKAPKITNGEVAELARLLQNDTEYYWDFFPKPYEL